MSFFNFEILTLITQIPEFIIKTYQIKENARVRFEILSFLK